jgi:hypothetical protein
MPIGPMRIGGGTFVYEPSFAGAGRVPPVRTGHNVSFWCFCAIFFLKFFESLCSPAHRHAGGVRWITRSTSIPRILLFASP